MSLAPGWAPHLSSRDPEFPLTFARLVTHYWSQGCFLQEGDLLATMHRLTDIPAVLTHGRYDVSGPLNTACTCTAPGRTASSWCSRTPATEEAASPASSSVPSTPSAPRPRPSVSGFRWWDELMDWCRQRCWMHAHADERVFGLMHGLPVCCMVGHVVRGVERTRPGRLTSQPTMAATSTRCPDAIASAPVPLTGLLHWWERAGLAARASLSDGEAERSRATHSRWMIVCVHYALIAFEVPVGTNLWGVPWLGIETRDGFAGFAILACSLSRRCSPRVRSGLASRLVV